MKALLILPALILSSPASDSDSERVLRMHRDFTASAFFKRDAVAKPIDFDHIDHALLSAAVFHETNRRRARHGLPALDYLPKLRQAALLQARDMREQRRVSHRGSSESLRTLGDRFDKVGLRGRFRAENVASVFGLRYEAGTPVYVRQENGARIFSNKPGGPAIEPHSYRSFARNLLDSWMNSPGHRKNILHTRPTALGTACLHLASDTEPGRFYCAQEFFAPFP